MATTTPNYGWPVPTSTDYVKDGATAIEALGDAIDATVFGLGSGGFVQIGTTQSFTTAATVNVNDVFSANYKNYRIVINGVGSSNADMSMRMRVSGTDNTAANYGFVRFYASAEPSSAPNGASTATAFTVGQLMSNRQGVLQLDIFNPFETVNTSYVGTGSGLGVHSTAWLLSGTLSVTTSYTGFTLIPSVGTITGNVSVFGIKVA
jgi:hypothetical protein